MNQRDKEMKPAPKKLESGGRRDESHARALLSEIVLMGLFVIISYVVAASFDIYEKFHLWSRGYEAYNLDEAPVILFALALALAWFAYRRWHQYQRELETRKRAEKQAEQAEQELRQAQKMEAVGQLTGGIAHDFSNLLTIIQGNVELLGEEDIPPELVRELAAEALAASQRGGELTRRLLAFARRQPLQPRPLDLNLLVAGMTGLLRRTLGAPVEIETVIGGDLWFAVADPLQVENAILNLALNARDAMPGGGVLRLESANVTLDADYAALHPDAVAGEFVLLLVSDSGAGMTPEVRERAFEPFFTTKPLGKGTGLGLSMVYGFARQSGGHVRIESEEGGGARISLYLPRTEEQPKAEESESGHIAAGDHGDGPRARILVVEDDPGVRRYCARVLAAAGYDVVQAEDGAGALALLEAEKDIDLLFTDILMPGGMDGWELAQRARGMIPGLAVLFASANPEMALEGGVEGSRAPRNLDLLRKPYGKDEIIRRVRHALEAPGDEP
ncbi:MAG: response regulator [Alphaproteobacteria bacterium]|nr:response regulator [Alphaproteobacteria bacterium]